jgi:L-2-hydroxyglutarate oxidase
MQYNIVIIGGGIVGLATALKLKQKYPNKKIALLEKENILAKHQTGNNSGVIHSGIYYKPGSLKAKNCINGYNQLLEFCDKEGVKYDLCGKIIVATDKKELPQLDMIYKRGLENGLSNIKKISGSEIKHFEPYCEGIAAIHVPYTGIIDYKEVANKYAEIFVQRFGGEIFKEHKVIDIQKGEKHIIVITPQHNFSADLVINCGGLYSDKIAEMTEKELNLKIIPFRGEYYMLKKERQHLVKNLIYPVPDPNFPFLGVHFTRMMKGGVEAGPNAVLAFRREGYMRSAFEWSEFKETLQWKGFQKVAAKYWKTGMGEFYRSFSKSAFTKALQRLIPDVQETDLLEGGAGVRAQACDKQGGLLDDFAIFERERIIHVCNAPSPAATSSLSIGETITEMASKQID